MTIHDDEPVASTSPERQRQLKDEANDLWLQSGLLGDQADLASARSEIITSCELAQLDLDCAEQELAEARKALAAAETACAPFERDLARVRDELAATHATGSLDDRLAARGRQWALEQELGPLAEQAAQLRGTADRAASLVTSYERDSLPAFRTALAQARAALASPPLDDVYELGKLAPDTARRRATRIGIFLLLAEPERARTPHGIGLLSRVRADLAACGALGLIYEDHLIKLYRQFPGQTRDLQAAIARQRADAALPKQVPEYKGITADTAPGELPPGHIWVDPATGEPPGPTIGQFPMITVGQDAISGQQLPAYDSAEGQKIRQDQRRQAPARMTGQTWDRPFG